MINQIKVIHIYDIVQYLPMNCYVNIIMVYEFLQKFNV